MSNYISGSKFYQNFANYPVNKHIEAFQCSCPCLQKEMFKLNAKAWRNFIFFKNKKKVHRCLDFFNKPASFFIQYLLGTNNFYRRGIYRGTHKEWDLWDDCTEYVSVFFQGRRLNHIPVE